MGARFANVKGILLIDRKKQYAWDKLLFHIPAYTSVFFVFKRNACC